MGEVVNKETAWVTTEDEYGYYKRRINKHGLVEELITRKQKWIDENPPAKPELKPIPIEDLLAEKDRQIIELKKMQSVTDTTVSEISTTLQELIEYTMEMGNI